MQLCSMVLGRPRVCAVFVVALSGSVERLLHGTVFLLQRVSGSENEGGRRTLDCSGSLDGYVYLRSSQNISKNLE